MTCDTIDPTTYDGLVSGAKIGQRVSVAHQHTPTVDGITIEGVIIDDDVVRFTITNNSGAKADFRVPPLAAPVPGIPDNERQGYIKVRVI